MNGEFYIDIGRIRLAHDYVLDRVRRCAYPHGREAFGLVLAITGGAEYRFATGERLTVEPGEVLFLSAGVAYTIVTERAFRHVTINFDVHRETSALGRFAAPYHLIRPDRAESISRRFRRIAELWRERTLGYEMQAVAELYGLFSLLDEAERVGHPSHRLSSAREYIEGHFASAFSLGELADLSGMSLTSFRREFRRTFGKTPLAYRDALRMDYAKELLLGGYYTLAEIAERCGYSDVGYFIRIFRREVGVTPRRYAQGS